MSLKAKQIVQIILFVIISILISGILIYFAKQQDDPSVESFKSFPQNKRPRNKGADGPVATTAVTSRLITSDTLDPKVSITCDLDKDNDVDLFDIASYWAIPLSVGNMKFCHESDKGTIRVYANECPLGPLEVGFLPNEQILLVNNNSIQWWNRTSEFISGPK